MNPYVKLDVLLLVCMFESFRIKSMNSFELKKKTKYLLKVKTCFKKTKLFVINHMAV